MGSRKAPARDETIAAEATPGRPSYHGPTTEQRRQSILESVHKLDDVGALRVDLFIKAILEDDPVLMSLACAPEDDEPETEEERRAVEEAEKEIEAGLTIPHEEVKRLWLGEGA